MVTFGLVDPEQVLLSEIADKAMDRTDVGLSYALALSTPNEVNWSKVNQAILDRWSLSGLKWIKDFAWKAARS
jgi:hypothetical protein